MPRTSTLSASTVVAAVLISQSAFADVTPSDVWGDWRDYMQGMGYQLNATENTSGDSLTVSDITIDMAMGDESGTMKMSFGTLTFTQNDDGSVAVVMPGVMPITINVAPEGPEAKPVQMQMSYAQTGHALTVSGDATNKTSDYSASSVTLTLDQLQVGDDTYGEDNAKFDISAADVRTTTIMQLGALRDYRQTGSIASVSFDMLINDPADANVAKIKGNVADLAISGGGMIPLGLAQVTDMGAMIRAGFETTGEITAGAGTLEMDVTDPENGNFILTTNSDSSNLNFDMGADGIAYSGNRNALAVIAEMAQLPFPVEMNMATAAFNLAMPVTKSEDPQDFALGLTFGDFTMSDMIWGIFDPTGQLPRDPATIALELTGKARLLIDYLDPAAAEKLAGSETTPGEVEALTINRLLVDVAGAELNGSGDFTFDNSDKSTFPGMPKPVGAVDLRLTGGNALIDKLVAMGIVPEEQAMGARMMMGLFAVPGDAPDSLKSKIEFNEQGQVLANGQRIK